VSQENVEQVERLTHEWAAGNWRAGEALLVPDVVLTTRVPEGRAAFEGRDAIAQFMREFLGQWERYWVDPEQFIDLGDKVLVIGHQVGIGATSGLEVREPWYAVFTFDDDRAVAITVTPDRHEGLEAAGLEE
jgi:ketosteroid isomerase-like protein